MHFDQGYIIWHRGQHGSITSNFHFYEFECPCGECQEQKISIDLVVRLQVLREHIGAPITITSAYRCEDYQRDLREAGYNTAITISQHELGRAADIYTEDLDLALADASFFFKAIGDAMKKDRPFLHFDLRRDKDRRWVY